MTRISILSFLLLHVLFAKAQDVARKFIDEGIAQYDAGEYEAAIESYQHAIYLDEKSYEAYYEIAMTYSAIGDCEKAIEHANKVLDMENNIHGMAYMIIGNCLDDQGKPEDAVELYENAIKKQGGSNLLHYNLTAKKEGKTEQEMFISNTKTFFKILGESKKKKYKDLWWNFYVPFFYEIAKTGHLTTYCYYITQSDDPANVQWINDHDKELRDFDQWLRN